jgi:TolA-binding protein
VHILTKFLMVFAAVLSIFLAALTIAYSANAERITQSLAGAQAGKIGADTALSAQSALHQSETARLNDQIQQLARDMADRAKEVNQYQTDNARLMADKNKAEASRLAIEGKIAELGELARTQAALITSYREEVTGLRQNELDYRTQMLGLEQRMSDLESQREVLEGTVRALQEQLAEAKTAQETALKGGTARSGRTGEPFTFTGPLIQARIETVSKDAASGATLAKISVGSNDQIRENMKMLVIRDGQFIANLVIVQTDLRWSVGRVETLGRTVEVKEGDLVWSRAQ